MLETWRWFGPLDAISLSEIVQTGAAGIVSALHEIPYGEIWSRDKIAARKAEIERAGLQWNVVESLPLHEDIKRGGGRREHYFSTYRQSLANLAAEGLKTICYNFMPVLDWTRTRLDAPLPGGATALRFDTVQMAAFEVHMLGREAARADYPETVLEEAKRWFTSSTQASRDTLLRSIMAGLPGAYDRYQVHELRSVLSCYEDMTASDLLQNYKDFLDQVIPAAEELGLALCVHPDDPPRPLMGLPRIVSNETDIASILSHVRSPANGLTLCSGSLGAHPDNDVLAIAERFASNISFAHLRNVTKEPNGSFQEAEHLNGDVEMVGLLAVLDGENSRRLANGLEPIPYRADHGHEIGPDHERAAHPGYPFVGRLRGLAELRGVLKGLGTKPN